ncbi:MAG: membrane protein insertase YidC, partial [Planctomycetota bacterium]|nr:membrane protein insertase YidC [Planctomycetota bacterium]
MKDNRTFLAIVVSLVVMFLYFQLIAPMIVPKAPPQPPKQTTPKEEPKHTCPVCCGDKYVVPEETDTPPGAGTTDTTPPQTGGGNGTAGGGSTTVTSEPESEFKHPDVEAQRFTLESDTLRAVVTNVGAAVESVYLKKFRSSRGEPELQLLQPLHETWRPFMVKDPDARDTADSAAWQVEPGHTGKMVSFTYTAPDGLKYTKTLEVSDKPYLMRMELSIDNLSPRAIDRQLQICTTAGIDVETEDTPSIRGLLARRDDNGLWRLDQELMLEKAAEKPSFDINGPKMWTGADNKYFAVVFVAENQNQAVRFGSVSFESFDVNEKTAAPGSADAPKVRNILTLVRTGMMRVAKTGDRITFNCPMFIGPKEEELLTGYSDVGLDRLLDYGTFEFISKILLAVLGVFFAMVKNYGVAIVLLTILIKLILFPLTKRGQ